MEFHSVFEGVGRIENPTYGPRNPETKLSQRTSAQLNAIKKGGSEKLSHLNY